MAHTSGPWAVHGSHIYAPDGAIIAVVHNPGSKASDYPLVANRDLMAAAPELLDSGQDARKALQAMMDAWLDYHDAHSLTEPVTGASANAFDKALAARDSLDEAIAKASPQPSRHPADAQSLGDQ